MTVAPLTDQRELQAAHQRLFTTVDAAVEAAATWSMAPSGLPGWTRGHVVAHLVGNAEGLRRLAHSAATGAEAKMYPSPESRAARIEELSAVPLAELATMLHTEAQLLIDDIAALDHSLGTSTLVLGSGAEIDAWELAMIRNREVEIHHVDLADGYRPTNWSSLFTLRTMNQVLPTFAARGNLPASALICSDTGHVWTVETSGPELVGSEHDLLAWLIGRPHEGLSTRDGSPVPVAPPWV